MDTSEIPRTLADPGSRRVPRSCCASVAVAGEIDLESGPDVVATLLAAPNSKSAGIVVDVSAYTFFSVAGMGAVIRAPNYGREHGRDLLRRAPPPAAWRVSESCDLTDLTDLAETARSCRRCDGDRVGLGRLLRRTVARGASSARSIRSMKWRLG